MPTAAWIEASKNTNRDPVLLMSLESINSQKAFCTNSADWAAGKTLSNCNTTTEPGTIFCATDGVEPYAGVYPEIVPLSNQDAMISNVLHWTNQSCVSVVLNFSYTNSRVGGVNIIELKTSADGVSWVSAGTQTLAANVGWVDASLTFDITKGHLYLQAFSSVTIYQLDTTWHTCELRHETLFLTEASTRTKTLDLEIIPTVNSVVSIEQGTPAGTTLAITARGSNDGSIWSPNLVNLNPASTTFGTTSMVDGAEVAPFRYYDFFIQFTSNSHVTPAVSEIGVTGGDSQRICFSTHEGTPASTAALPFLIPDLGALSSKIELMKLGSIGEVSPKLFYLQPTFEMVRDGRLRNKAVILKMGFNSGMSEQDYEPLFTGLWYDGTVDLASQTITAKTRTVFSLFSKASLPAEASLGAYRDTSNVLTVEYSKENIMNVMLDVLDLMGIKDRYVDRPSFTNLASGARSGPDWLVSRRIDKDNKAAAIELLEELSVLSGVFLLQLPNGQISAKLHDPVAEIVTELTSDIATFSAVSLGQADLYTRQQILFNPKHDNDLPDGSAWGSWASGRAYVVGDMVIAFSGQIWHCIAAHTSMPTSQPGMGPGYKAYWLPRWSSKPVAYAAAPVASQVVYNGFIYTCILNHTSSPGSEPGVVSGWDMYWRVGGSIAIPLIKPWDWATGKDYSRGDSVYYSGALYRCLLSHKSDATNCPVVGLNRKPYWATEWVAGHSYTISDVVTHNGPLYTCRGDHLSSGETEPNSGDNWSAWWTTSPVKGSLSEGDFYSAFVLINDAAEITWGLNADTPEQDPDYQKNPGYQKKWMDKWNASPAAREALAQRMDSWFANPKMKLKASNLPPQYWTGKNGEELLGSLVGVTGLMLPSSDAIWGVPCNKKKFLVLGKTLDPRKCTVSLDLLEV